jgi:ABC-type phosphate/phosphonate transport system substrate-binding protein
VIAQLGMYPFAHLCDEYDRLWSAVRRHLGDAPDQLDRDAELHAGWTLPDLLVGQTCGWPLVTRLSDTVEVIGAFDVGVPFAVGGRYRSVLIASKPIGIDVWKSDPATMVARNSTDSLSGWISMQWAWGAEPTNVLATGAHLGSMRAVASGDAHVASIDAVTFELVCEVEPSIAGRVHVIGHGPSVPSLPLVMAKGLAGRRDEVRAAFAAVVADPSMSATCAALRIRGFVPFGFADYGPLMGLLPAR